MPGKNIIKLFEPEGSYHIYNRGINRSEIFLDAADYGYFEWLVERCLSPAPTKDPKGREYLRLDNDLELNAYCLMPNHFHLLCYQYSIDGVTKFIRSVCTAYTMYFNKKYKRRGPLFENSYRAVPILRDGQLLHISRYIHLNHKNFRTWPHSSLADYLGISRPWVTPDRIMGLFDSLKQYHKFVLDYEQAQRELESIKRELANGY
jgi:putative transposase